MMESLKQLLSENCPARPPSLIFLVFSSGVVRILADGMLRKAHPPVRGLRIAACFWAIDWAGEREPFFGLLPAKSGDDGSLQA